MVKPSASQSTGKRATKVTNPMSAARGPIEMARARPKQSGPLKKWWHSKREYHFRAYTSMTLFFSALTLYCFVFMFFMDGVQSLEQEGRDNLIPFVWLGLLGGSVALFLVAPDFFYFLGQKQILEDILELDSRPEVLRRRKEAEIAADMLGSSFQSRLKGLYEQLGVKVPKRYVVESQPPTRAFEESVDSGSEEEE